MFPSIKAAVMFLDSILQRILTGSNVKSHELVRPENITADITHDVCRLYALNAKGVTTGVVTP
jgi:hypothetical protein